MKWRERPRESQEDFRKVSSVLDLPLCIISLPQREWRTSCHECWDEDRKIPSEEMHEWIIPNGKSYWNTPTKRSFPRMFDVDPPLSNTTFRHKEMHPSASAIRVPGCVYEGASLLM
jgi:hypothetical protein